MDQDLKAYLEELAGRLERRLDRVDERLDRMEGRHEQMDGRLDQMETEIRHTRVLVEDLRSDLRLVAEGVMGATERLEAFQDATAKGFEEVKASLTPAYKSLDGRIQSLDSNVQTLDSRMVSLNSRVSLLEARAERQNRDVLEVIREKFGKPQA